MFLLIYLLKFLELLWHPSDNCAHISQFMGRVLRAASRYCYVAGDYCDECEVGYYGNAVAGAAAEACRLCPCYPPRVVNSTCHVTGDGNVSCLYCNEGHTGPLCDQ